MRSVGSWGVLLLGHIFESVLKGGSGGKKKKAKKTASASSPERDALEGVAQALLALMSTSIIT